MSELSTGRTIINMNYLVQRTTIIYSFDRLSDWQISYDLPVTDPLSPSCALEVK